MGNNRGRVGVWHRGWKEGLQFLVSCWPSFLSQGLFQKSSDTLTVSLGKQCARFVKEKKSRGRFSKWAPNVFKFKS